LYFFVHSKVSGAVNNAIVQTRFFYPDNESSPWLSIASIPLVGPFDFVTLRIFNRDVAARLPTSKKEIHDPSGNSYDMATIPGQEQILGNQFRIWAQLSAQKTVYFGVRVM
jgi:hypothetical protein